MYVHVNILLIRRTPVGKELLIESVQLLTLLVRAPAGDADHESFLTHCHGGVEQNNGLPVLERHTVRGEDCVEAALTALNRSRFGNHYRWKRKINKIVRGILLDGTISEM